MTYVVSNLGRRCGRCAPGAVPPALLALLSLLALASPAVAQSFPDDAEWVPLTRQGEPLSDPLNDSQDERDIVGDADNPAAYLYGDAEFIYFRLRVDQNPLQGSGFRPFGWGVEIDVDGDPSAYEFLAMVDGIANPDVVTLQQNTSPGTNGARDPAETSLGSWSTDTHARGVEAPSGFGGDPDYFVDWAIPRGELEDAGLDPSQPLSFAFGTSNNAQTLASDLSGTTTSQSLQDILSDPVSCDGNSCESCDSLCGQACVRCGGATPACNGTECVECATGADCPAETPLCDRDTNTCTQGSACRSDADCEDPELPACQPDGSCGQCSADNQAACGGSTPLCEVAAGRCTACTVDADCGDPASPACRPDGRCAECSADNRVRCTGVTPVCDVAEGECTLPCESDDDCEDAERPACQPDGRCDQCSESNSDACDAALEACNVPAGRCAEACAADADCNTARPLCRDQLVCIECTATDESACTEARPVCEADVGQCVVADCEADADCDDAALPACLDGRCTQCSSDNTERCTGELTVCDESLGGICVVGEGAGTPDGGAADGGAPDAGASGDGGGGEDDDAGTGTGTGAAIEGGGCGCRVHRAQESAPSLLALTALLGLLFWRRRRHGRAHG